MTKVEASLFHGMGLGSGNPNHDLAEVRPRLHVRERIPGLFERKNLVHNRVQLNLRDRRIHLFEHRTRADVNPLYAELFVQDGCQCERIGGHTAREHTNLRHHALNPSSA